jgi:hypothetical protein
MLEFDEYLNTEGILSHDNGDASDNGGMSIWKSSNDNSQFGLCEGNDIQWSASAWTVEAALLAAQTSITPAFAVRPPGETTIRTPSSKTPGAVEEETLTLPEPYRPGSGMPEVLRSHL